MRIIISVFIIFFLVFSANGQSFVDVSKTKKIIKEGVELTTFEGKPFTGFITENYPNGKTLENNERWFSKWTIDIFPK